MTIELMLPTPSSTPFSAQNWIFEPKLDGYRALCLIENNSVRFMSRNKKELTKRFPELSTIHQSINSKAAILDGEIVGLDEKGRPCFEDLQNRKKCHVVYFAFDLLMLNHNDLRGEPLMNRKEALKKIITPAPHLRLTEYVVEEGEQLFSVAQFLHSQEDSTPLAGSSSSFCCVMSSTSKCVSVEGFTESTF